MLTVKTDFETDFRLLNTTPHPDTATHRDVVDRHGDISDLETTEIHILPRRVMVTFGKVEVIMRIGEEMSTKDRVSPMMT